MKIKIERPCNYMFGDANDGDLVMAYGEVFVKTKPHLIEGANGKHSVNAVHLGDGKLTLIPLDCYADLVESVVVNLKEMDEE